MRRRLYEAENPHSRVHVAPPKMEQGAEPMELKYTFRVWDTETADKHRGYSCPHYDRCLTFAISKGWTNWSCRRCPKFRAARIAAMIGEAGVASVERLDRMLVAL